MNNILSQKVDRKVVQKILAVFTMAILASSGSIILLPATVPAAYAAVTPTVSNTVLGETNIIQIDIDDSNLDKDSDFPEVVVTQDDTTDQSLFFTRMTDGSFRAYMASDAADLASIEDLPLRGTHDSDDGAVENSSPFDYAVDTDADSENEVLFGVKRGVGAGSKIPAYPGTPRTETTATGDITGDGDANDSDILIDPRFVSDVESIIGTADSIDRDTWPIVQLFDLDQDDDFKIEYTTASTEVAMTSDLAAGDDDESVLDIVSVDRTSVPTEGLLRVTVSWPERNLDPTAENDELIAAFFRVNGEDVDVDEDSGTSDDAGDHDIFHATQDGNNGNFVMQISMEEDNAQEPEQLNDAGSGTAGVLDNNDAVEIIVLDWDYTGAITDTSAEFSVGEDTTANFPDNTPDDGFGGATGQLDIPGDHGDRTTVVVTESDGSLELIGTPSYNSDLTIRITDEDFNVDTEDDDSIDGDADGDGDSTLNLVITFDGATDVVASVNPEETGDNTGVFEATVEWRLAATHAKVAGEDTDELIMSLPADNPAKDLDVDVVYDDPTTLVSTADREQSEDFSTTEGSLALDKATYTLSLLDTVKMSFTLPNANDDTSSIETLRIDISDTGDGQAGEYVEVIHLQTGQEVGEIRMLTTKTDEDRETADLSAELSGDIILTETGANTGIFESGYVDLSVLDEIDAVAEFAVATKLRLQYYDDAQDDDITVDVDLDESLSTGTLSLDRDKLGITSAATIALAPDIEVTVSLTDADENGDPLLREEATIDLTLKSGGGDTLYFDDDNDADVAAADSTDELILYESAVDSSIFEGKITMRISEVGTDFLYDNDGDQTDETIQILESDDDEIDPEDLVNARLTYDYDDDSVDIDLVFTARTAVITASATTVDVGDEITITLTAPDFNLEPDDTEDLDGTGEHESALKFVDADGDNVAINLGLEETGDNTGIFTVDITIGDAVTTASATDDDLSWPDEVKAGETLTLKFVDDVLASSSSGELVDDTIELDIAVSAHTATLTLDKTEYGPYQEVTVTLVDADLKLVPDDYTDSTFPVLSRIRTNGESLNTAEIGSAGRDINETGEKDGDDTFEWKFTMDTDSDNTGDATKKVLVDVADVGLDLLEVFYEDGEDAGGDDLVIKDTADIRTRTGVITVTPTVIDIDETFSISLVDADANANDDIIETVTVEVSSETFPGGQDITLTETGDDTGIFENAVITVVDTIPEGSQIWASVEDTITIEYEDTLDDTGDDLKITASLRVGVIPTFPVPASGAKVVNTAGTTLDASAISTGSLVIVETSVTNDAPVAQDFAYIVQIKDTDGVIVMFNFQTGELATGATLSPGISWVPATSGAYTIEIFVFESLATPSPLSEQLSLSATVV